MYHVSTKKTPFNMSHYFLVVATGHVSLYSCCNADSHSEGCQVHPLHVSDVMELKGFVSTKDPDDDEVESSKVTV